MTKEHEEEYELLEIEMIDDSKKYKPVVIKNVKKELFPAGFYYVGDLCYLLQDEKNDKFISLYKHYVCGFVYGKDNKNKKRFVTCEDISFFGYFNKTSYGYCGFKDNNGNRYSIITCLLGIVQLTTNELLLKARSAEEYTNAKVLQFNEPFEVCSKRGKFIFGDVIISGK